MFCFMIFSSFLSLKKLESIGTEKSYLSFYFTWTITQIAMVSAAKFILTISWRYGHENRIVSRVGIWVEIANIFTKVNSSNN